MKTERFRKNRELNTRLNMLVSTEYASLFRQGRYIGSQSTDVNKSSDSSNKGEMKMTNNTVVQSGSVSYTKDALLTSAQEGLKLAAAQKASRELTAAVRSLAGSAYPTSFFDTPTGHVVECLLVPMALHALTQVVDVPSGDTIRRACELAMTAEVKDKLSGVLDALVPTLCELGKRLETAKV